MISLSFSAFSGLLTGLSFCSPNLSFLVWFSLVPFIQALYKVNVKKSILCGLIFGLFYQAIAIFWIGNVTKLGLSFLLFYLSLYYVIFSVLARCFFVKPWDIILFSCFWVIVEFLKENIWCGFGWANLGYSQFRNFYLIQITDLFGVKFLSFFIVLVNFLIWSILARGLLKGKIKRGILKNGIIVLAIALVCFLYAFYRVADLKTDKSIKVAVIQPNIPQSLKWEDFATSLIIGKLENLSKKSKENSLVIFPEATWPHTVNDDNFNQLNGFIKSLKRDALIGAVTKKNGKFYNSALMFDKKKGLIGTYNKIKLVPFGEYIPMREALGFISIINSVGDISRGNRMVSFPYNDKSFSVLICFEDIFPMYSRQVAAKNDFLINITNDAWFKGEPQASQHLGIMVLRAVENRISIIRSANTGISGWVSYKGEIKKMGKNGKVIFQDISCNLEVPLNKKRSFYNRYGEVFSFFCMVLLVAVLLRDAVKRRKK